MRALRLPTRAFPVTYLFRFRGPRDPSLLRVRCCQRSRAIGGYASGQDHCSAGDPISGSCSRGREWDLPGSQATHPVPLPRSKTPAELTIPCLDGLISAAPASITAKASADGYIEATAGLQHLLSTLQEWCCHHHMQDSLPAGWLAFTGRESNPLDRVERFPSATSLSPSLDLS